MDNKTKEELIRQGRLKPLSEAFKEYPVEEELHQGDSRFFICDSIIKYGKYNVGDIVRTKKQHPCGSKLWEITRVGVDFKLKCQGCGHIVVLDRPKALKIITKKETGKV